MNTNEIIEMFLTGKIPKYLSDDIVEINPDAEEELAVPYRFTPKRATEIPWYAPKAKKIILEQAKANLPKSQFDGKADGGEDGIFDYESMTGGLLGYSRRKLVEIASFSHASYDPRVINNPFEQMRDFFSLKENLKAVSGYKTIIGWNSDCQGSRFPDYGRETLDDIIGKIGVERYNHVIFVPKGYHYNLYTFEEQKV